MGCVVCGALVLGWGEVRSGAGRMWGDVVEDGRASWLLVGWKVFFILSARSYMFREDFVHPSQYLLAVEYSIHS